MIRLADAFNLQADACENLDSPFTAMLLRQVALNLRDDHPVARICMAGPAMTPSGRVRWRCDWPGR